MPTYAVTARNASGVLIPVALVSDVHSPRAAAKFCQRLNDFAPGAAITVLAAGGHLWTYRVTPSETLAPIEYIPPPSRGRWVLAAGGDSVPAT